MRLGPSLRVNAAWRCCCPTGTEPDGGGNARVTESGEVRVTQSNIVRITE